MIRNTSGRERKMGKRKVNEADDLGSIYVAREGRDTLQMKELESKM